MAFRECDVFFLGTASRNGGNNSSTEAKLGSLHSIAEGRKDGRNAVAERRGRENGTVRLGHSMRDCCREMDAIVPVVEGLPTVTRARKPTAAAALAPTLHLDG